MLVACNAATPDIPWLHGLDHAVSSTGVGVPRAPADYNVEPGCGVAASREVELVVDVARTAGRETIVATYSTGVAVFDHEDHLVMETPGYPCEGSADELDAIAVGDAYGTPMLALAATSGGRRETQTWVSLFHIGNKRLDPVFTAVVETRADDTVTSGAIYLIPEGLLYKRPGGSHALWRIDPASKIYVPVLPDTPHDEPPLVSLR
jgi:hypothetical protein